ncbi:MAG: 2,3-bisphosphoglycerate-independent phosphoglycerate mutase [Clostridiales bacterium]|nr:MAG: 2,3-bisphosphoglycerate-independent phosphoglycerate mutase [Clostridiales bacterium]
MKTPFMLMILDGFGINTESYGNAIASANLPNLNRIFREYPSASLKAGGLAVGLPDGQMGNSEVGHLNIGAGRVVYQELTRISKAIDDGILNGNAALLNAMNHASSTGGALHVMGLLSDGGVHSHIDHIKAVIKMASAENVPRIYVHCFMDGRDVPPTSGIDYMKDMESFISDIPTASIGVVSGRYYAMDRDKRWERVKLAYEALTSCRGVSSATGFEAVSKAYENGDTDEFIKPAVCGSFPGVKSGDSIIFCNFRPDRAREITRCFTDPEFDGFERYENGQSPISDLCYVCMTQYDATMPNVEVAFPPSVIKNTLGEYLSSLGYTQLRIAETEKYAHVTFFFNGGVEKPNPNEDRILIPSPKVATYDLKPEMSAPEVTEAVIKEIKSLKYDYIILNFANADMVGHTGNFEAAVKAVEAVDKCVGEIEKVMLEVGGRILLTADHGNADEMKDRDGNAITSHSTNPVPLVYIAENPCPIMTGGKLCDIAPTVLKLTGVPIPGEMTGKPLV